GHCDGEPDVLAVALREAQEESGIQTIIPLSENIFDIDVCLIPATLKEPEHYHYDIRFLLKVIGDSTFIKSDESHALRWVGKSLDELPTRDWSIVRMFIKWCAKFSDNVHNIQDNQQQQPF